MPLEIIRKVRAAIMEHQLFLPGERVVVVGVSGGPDSLALLRILSDLVPEFGIELHVAHLNHSLRGAEAEADAEFVAGVARAWGLAITVEARDVRGYAVEHRLSIEEAARVVRYGFLRATAARLGAHAVAVGHNADDQVETVLMHFLRGAGLAGLRGMEYKSAIPGAAELEPGQAKEHPASAELTDSAGAMTSISLIRPLLDVFRSEIEEFLQAEGLQPREDRTNLDTTFYRNRLRHEVIPYLEQFNPNLREVLQHSALSIADDYDLLHAEAERVFSTVARRANGAFVFDLKGWRQLPPSMQRATLREAVRRLHSGLRNINWQHIKDARRVALKGETAAEATLPEGLFLVVGYDDFTIGESMPQPDMPLLHVDEIKLRIGSLVQLPDSQWAVRLDEIQYDPEMTGETTGPGLLWSARLDADSMRGDLVLRRRRAGERFQPSGMGGRSKSLHEFMIDEKIPAPLRDLIPILADRDKILWVCGYRVDERAIVTPGTGRLLTVEFLRDG